MVPHPETGIVRSAAFALHVVLRLGATNKHNFEAVHGPGNAVDPDLLQRTTDECLHVANKEYKEGTWGRASHHF